MMIENMTAVDYDPAIRQIEEGKREIAEYEAAMAARDAQKAGVRRTGHARRTVMEYLIAGCGDGDCVVVDGSACVPCSPGGISLCSGVLSMKRSLRQQVRIASLRPATMCLSTTSSPLHFFFSVLCVSIPQCHLTGRLTCSRLPSIDGQAFSISRPLWTYSKNLLGSLLSDRQCIRKGFYLQSRKGRQRAQSPQYFAAIFDDGAHHCIQDGTENISPPRSAARND